jgi:hypothetical protein
MTSTTGFDILDHVINPPANKDDYDLEINWGGSSLTDSPGKIFLVERSSGNIVARIVDDIIHWYGTFGAPTPPPTQIEEKNFDWMPPGGPKTPREKRHLFYYSCGLYHD